MPSGQAREQVLASSMKMWALDRTPRSHRGHGRAVLQDVAHVSEANLRRSSSMFWRLCPSKSRHTQLVAPSVSWRLGDSVAEFAVDGPLSRQWPCFGMAADRFEERRDVKVIVLCGW